MTAATQNQALNALVFMYRYVLDKPLGELQSLVRAKKPKRLPVVLTQQEVTHLLSHFTEVHWLIGCLIYGSGHRLMESVRLRVKDIDFSHRAIFVRDGKGGKHRTTKFSTFLIE